MIGYLKNEIARIIEEHGFEDNKRKWD